MGTTANNPLFNHLPLILRFHILYIHWRYATFTDIMLYIMNLYNIKRRFQYGFKVTNGSPEVREKNTTKLKTHKICSILQMHCPCGVLQSNYKSKYYYTIESF